jgi:hypothetical protein
MPFEAIRKAACSFGWDWGPATFTSGIWRPVRLESWSTARLDDVRVHAEPTGAGALGRRHRPRHPHVGCRPRPHARRRRSLGVGNDPCGETSATASVDLVAVESWWPAGHGDPTLYDVAVSLVSGGEVVDSVTRRVGFRTLRWDTTPDAGGTPSSSSSTTARSTSRASTGSRTTRSRCAWTAIATPATARAAPAGAQARAANLNLVRVWGGGPSERGAAGAPRVAGPAHGQQREPVGSRGLGLEGATGRHGPGGRTTTTSCCRRSWPRSRPTSLCAGQPLQPGRATPQRHEPRHDAPVGAVELTRLADVPRGQAAVRGRVRVAGPARVVDPEVSDQRRPARPRSHPG